MQQCAVAPIREREVILVNLLNDRLTAEHTVLFYWVIQQ
jgi:hypothetical protein